MTVTHAPAPAPVRAAGFDVRPGPVLAFIVLGAVAVIALWWRDTASVAGPDGWLTNAGRISGLLCGYGMAVLIALMARVPALERGVGTDRLTRWHAMGGRYVIGLVTAHILAVIWGYAFADAKGVVDETVTMVLTFPEMLKATAACLLLLGTAALSARAARRRMRYETWYLLHFYTYVAAYLAFGHQLATGAEFTGDRAARIAWYILYLGVAALVVWYRFLAPVRLSLRHRLRVAAVTEEGPGVISIHIIGRDLGRLRVEPGQFFRWRFLAKGLWWSANPYSLSAPPGSDGFRITVKALGDHSGSLAGLRPGVRVFAEGPYGAFTGRVRRRRRVLLIAGGVGITPVRALFESLPGELTLLYRARSEAELVFREELEDIANARGARLHYSTGPRDTERPFDPATLAAVVPGLRHHDVYVCGPTEMTRTAIRALRASGVPQRQIHHESFEF